MQPACIASWHPSSWTFVQLHASSTSHSAASPSAAARPGGRGAALASSQPRHSLNPVPLPPPHLITHRVTRRCCKPWQPRCCCRACGWGCLRTWQQRRRLEQRQARPPPAASRRPRQASTAVFQGSGCGASSYVLLKRIHGAARLADAQFLNLRVPPSPQLSSRWSQGPLVDPMLLSTCLKPAHRTPVLTFAVAAGGTAGRPSAGRPRERPDDLLPALMRFVQQAPRKKKNEVSWGCGKRRDTAAVVAAAAFGSACTSRCGMRCVHLTIPPPWLLATRRSRMRSLRPAPQVAHCCLPP